MSKDKRIRIPAYRPGRRNSTAEFLTFAYQTGGDGVEVRVQDGTIWLSQKGIGQLFDTTPENILMHLRHIYAEGELDEGATAKEYLVVRTEVARTVRRNIKHYDLDTIIAVGYRVSSKRAALPSDNGPRPFSSLRRSEACFIRSSATWCMWPCTRWTSNKTGVSPYPADRPSNVLEIASSLTLAPYPTRANGTPT